MRVTIRVPATSANLGPGFDIFGLALQIQNQVVGQQRGDGVITVDGSNLTSDPSANLIARAYTMACRQLDVSPADWGVDISSIEEIPRARGLGSSAAAALAGVLIAAGFFAAPWDENQILDIVAEFEGHRDNAAAALCGGLSIAAPGAPIAQLSVPEELRAVLFIPDIRLATSEARRVVPQTVSRGDAIFNAARCALLVRALLLREYSLLGTAMEDRWHQTQRVELMPWMPDVISAAVHAGAYGAALSGAGPTVLALAVQDCQVVGAAMAAAAERRGVEGAVRVIEIRNYGARIDVDA